MSIEKQLEEIRKVSKGGSLVMTLARDLCTYTRVLLLLGARNRNDDIASVLDDLQDLLSDYQLDLTTQGGASCQYKK